MLRLVVAACLALGLAAGCHAAKSPELRVLGVHDAPASHVFVQVTNPARRPMQLTKLAYVFASARDGATVAEGEVKLDREIPAGAAVVVEVPLEADARDTLRMHGTLTAELDQIVRSFKLDAEIQPH
jgi:hypothetical protein